MNLKSFLVANLILIPIVSNNMLFSYADISTLEKRVSKNAIKDTIHSTVEKMSLKLNLEDAVKLAVENNKDIELQNIKLERQKFEYDENKSQTNTYIMYSDFGLTPPPVYPATTSNTEVNKKLYLDGIVNRYLNLTYESAVSEKDQLVEDIQYKTEKSYYSLLLKLKEYTVDKENLSLATKQYEDSKILLSTGQISEHDLSNANIALKQADAKSKGAYMAYLVELFNFNSILGIPISTEVTLLEDINYVDYSQKNIDIVVQEALWNNPQLNYLKSNYEIQNIVLEEMNTKYRSLLNEYKQQKMLVLEIEKNIGLTKNSIEAAVRSSYLSLMNAKDNIILYEESIALSEKSLEITELNYSLGLSTHQDLQTSRLSLIETKKNHVSALYQYQSALLDFKKSISE